MSPWQSEKEGERVEEGWAERNSRGRRSVGLVDDGPELRDRQTGGRGGLWSAAYVDQDPRSREQQTTSHLPLVLVHTSQPVFLLPV
jgi:hypothetical protein